MTRITEPDLILPALYVIHKQPGITTGELIKELREIFNPIGEDAEILRGRNDDKFSQIVRNLVSHHTLDQRLGFTVLRESGSSNATHVLSNEGAVYLYENIYPLENLLSNNFGYQETLDGVTKITTEKLVDVYDENMFITEGRRKPVTSRVYERSTKLRNAAIDFYTRDGKIVCEACGFDFYKTYGDVGSGYIEIHHQKPIYQYEEADFSRVISEALKDLIPLCANCHRMTHRRRGNPLSLQELREILANNSS